MAVCTAVPDADADAEGAVDPDADAVGAGDRW
jgi:hypothetical protein